MLLDTFSPDNLILGGEIGTDEGIIASGQNLKRGSVLGKVRFAIPTSGTLAGTGNGTVTVVSGGPKTKQGTYTITLTSLATTMATFSVTDPDGKHLGSATVGLGTNDTARFGSEQINFLLTNGSTDFDATSVFTVAVTSYVPSSASVSGTGNGTLPQLEARRLARRGAYKATCASAPVAGVHAGLFTVTDPSSNVLGTAYAGYRHNGAGAATGTGALTEIKAGPKFKKNGPYLIKCTAAATNGGTFSVTDPDGAVIGTVALPGSSTGVATFWNEQLSFKLADATDFILDDEIVLYWYESDYMSFVIWAGSTPFIATDSFTMTVALADEEYKLVNRDNVDGSAYPVAILADDVDATNAAKATAIYTGGTFSERSLYFGGDDTIAHHRDALRVVGILTKLTQAAGQ